MACVSVLCQTFEDLELIVIDDASSENAADLLKSIDDPRLKVVRRAVNGGAGAARNTGLHLARGEFIAFQDSDDVWMPGKLEKQVRALSLMPVEVGALIGARAVCSTGLKGADRPLLSIVPSPEGRLLSRDQPRQLLRENRLSLQASLFRADCLPDRQWFDERARASEDWDFAIRLAQHCRLVESPDVVTFSVTSDDSISQNAHKLVTGNIRLIKNNAALFASNRKQLAKRLIQTSNWLRRIGKRGSATRLMRAAFCASPWAALVLAGFAWNKVASLTRPFHWRRMRELNADNLKPWGSQP